MPTPLAGEGPAQWEHPPRPRRPLDTHRLRLHTLHIAWPKPRLRDFSLQTDTGACRRDGRASLGAVPLLQAAHGAGVEGGAEAPREAGQPGGSDDQREPVALLPWRVGCDQGAEGAFPPPPDGPSAADASRGLGRAEQGLADDTPLRQLPVLHKRDLLGAEG